MIISLGWVWPEGYSFGWVKARALGAVNGVELSAGMPVYASWGVVHL